jgi:hypothetical protein
MLSRTAGFGQERTVETVGKYIFRRWPNRYPTSVFAKQLDFPTQSWRALMQDEFLIETQTDIKPADVNVIVKALTEFNADP